LSREGMKIFIGDFIDSFDRSEKDHQKCFELVLEAIKKDEAESLFGNHELSYIQPFSEIRSVPIHRCSGYSYKRHQIIRMFKHELTQYFKPYLLLEPTILITHAGLTRRIWGQFNLSFDSLEKTLENWWLDANSPMHWIGNYRGGIHPVGGLFWCDWNAEFEPVPELTQVFGHTAGHSIRQKENSFCIDCLDHTNDFLTFEL
jgi:hypothetical protein